MFQHITVLKEEAVAGLNIDPHGVYVDCTLGGAGHSTLIASKLSREGLLIGLDRDEMALEHASTKLSTYHDRVKLIKSDFRNLQNVLSGPDLNIPLSDDVPQVQGILFDLGVSSPQLDQADRGFSYQHEAELDMRMDQTAALTAYDIVNTWSFEEIKRILFEYGEEKFAAKIASNIVKLRETKPIESTSELAEIIKASIPAATRRTGPHPARRSFQGIRIAVNDELGAFEAALEQSLHCLAPGGRIAVITFHSLEDRICKRFFAKFVERCTCPSDFPQCVCGNKGKLKLINRKPIVPSAEELAQNTRARSAKLRIAEKI